MKSKKNISLIIGLAIPVLMIVLVAASIYLPGLFAPQPRVNFLDVTGDNEYQGPAYVVERGTLVKRDVTYSAHNTPEVPRFFVYDVLINESAEVSFEDAQKLRLDPNLESPDGYAVAYGGMTHGVFPFYFSEDRDYDSLYLQGHNASKKLKLQRPMDGRYSHYRNRARFLGWVR